VEVSGWLRIAFEGAKTHAVPSQLALPLIADMMKRGCPVENFETKYGKEHAATLKGNPAAITEWGFDCGGMWITGEPEEMFTIDGLAIDVPCAQYDFILADVMRSEERVFANGERYHKLKFWMHATVLAPIHMVSLRVAMRLRKATAKRRASEFDAERKAKAAAREARL
jgi:hypothetical protein